jgi:hypothetical protein
MTTVTDTGVAAVSQIINWVSPVPAAFIYIANGSSSTAEGAEQNALGAENTLYGSARATADCSYVSPATCKWVKLFSFSGAVTIREVGIFNSGTVGGTMLLRHVFNENKTYGDGEAVEITVTNQFRGS